MGWKTRGKVSDDPASSGVGEVKNNPSSTAPGTAGGVGGYAQAEWGPAKPRICWGMEVKDSQRLKCGEEVSDPRIVNEVAKLISEFIRRVERYRSVLLSDEITPFSYAISALSDWLKVVVVEVDTVIMELKAVEHEVGKNMLKLAEEAREKWFKIYRSELEELIEKLRKGEAVIIITGDPFNESRSFIAHLYTRYLAIEIERIAKSPDNITIEISLSDLGGIDVVMPKLFSDNILEAMRYGLLLTDGSIVKGYPAMNTNQLWQVIAWILVWSGIVHIYINGININNNISIKWHLRAISHRDKIKNKDEVVKLVLKLNNDEFLIFLLFALLGDGHFDIKNKMIKLDIGVSKYELWVDIIKKIKSYGFKEYDSRNKKTYIIWTYKAIELTRKMLSSSTIKAMIESLSILPDAEKLRRLIALTNIKIKPRGSLSIEIDNIKMSIHVRDEGYIEIRILRKNYEDARAIQERLNSAGYKAKLRKNGKSFEVCIDIDEIKRHPELIAKVCDTLRRIHEETINENNAMKAWKVAKAIMRLNCRNPT